MKFYQYQLIGDPVCSGGSVILEIGESSFSKETLENLEKEVFEDEDCIVYSNTDLSGPPQWIIVELDMI